MKKSIIYFILFVTSAIYADILSEYEILFKYLEKNYETALSIDKTTRIFKDYEEKFQGIVKKSVQMQNKLDFNKIKNIDIDVITKKMYSEFKRSRKIDESGMWHKSNKDCTTSDMKFFRNSIGKYIKKLKAMNFPDNINWENEKAYLFKYFQKLYKNSKQRSENILESLKKAAKEKNYRKRAKQILNTESYKKCDEDFVELVKTAKILQNNIELKKIKDVELHKECLVIRNTFKQFVALVEEETSANKYAKEKQKKNRSRNAKKVKDKEHIKIQEMKYSIDLIDEHIKTLKDLGYTFINDNLLKKKNSNNKNAFNENEPIDLSSKMEMLNKLRALRNKIISSSNITIGGDANVTEQYIKTLTTKEKSLYDQLLKKYIIRFDKKMAEFRAVKDLHGKLKIISDRAYKIQDLEEVFKRNEEKKPEIIENIEKKDIIFTGIKENDIKLISELAKQSKEKSAAVFKFLMSLEKIGDKDIYIQIKDKSPDEVIAMANSIQNIPRKITQNKYGIPFIKAGLFLFDNDGMHPRKEVLSFLSGNELKEEVLSSDFSCSPKGPCEILKLTGKDNFIKYTVFPFPTAPVVMKSVLSLNLTNSDSSQNINDIATFITLAHKMSIFMTGEKLPTEILDAIKILEEDPFSDKQAKIRVGEFKIKFLWGDLTITSLKKVNGFSTKF